MNAQHLFGLVLGLGLVLCGDTVAVARPPAPVPAITAAGATTAAAPVLATSWWNRGYDSFASAVGNQRRMVQVMTVVAVLALFIIWWRKT
jgi:hypothetical protein